MIRRMTVLGLKALLRHELGWAQSPLALRSVATLVGSEVSMTDHGWMAQAISGTDGPGVQRERKERVAVDAGDRDDKFAVEVRGLVKTYSGTQAVGGIDLAIRHGEIFALLGPNGAERPLRWRSWRASAAATAGRSACSAWIRGVTGPG